jgi:uncharacterized membrane protein YbaN (DUF454 family)
MVGVLLPVLPTTPFLLVALWAGSRGNSRLRFRLYRHPRFGPPLRDWQRHRALSARVKLGACGVIVISTGLLWFSAPAMPLALSVSALLLAVGGYLLTRPGCPRQPGKTRSPWQLAS